VGVADGAERAGDRAELPGPVWPAGRTGCLGDVVGDLVAEGFDDAVEEGLFAVDVVVERHRAGAELLGEGAHAEGGQAVAVDQRERGSKDLCS
jgi:hypothetical protein